MGRYISGDVKGKCWFALQNSNFMDRFGVYGFSPDYISYYYSTKDLPAMQEELKNIEESLGDAMQKIDAFFEERVGYTNEQLKEPGISKKQLSDYADYKFAKKVEAYILENGSCSFDVEL